jgi:hypothetical protein
MRYPKILIAAGLLILLVGALFIRHQEAGYIAYLNGNFKTAEAEFIKRAENGGMWEAYLVGSMNENPTFRVRNLAQASKAYLNSAELGNVAGAMKYILFINHSAHRNIDCTTLNRLTERAIQTHHFVAVHTMERRFLRNSCSKLDKLKSLQYTKWAGELEPQYGSNFHREYQNLTTVERKKFDGTKLQKPSRISDAEFLKFFFATLAQIKPA